MLKTVTIIILLAIPSFWTSSQESKADLKNKVRDFFFGISLDSSIQSIKGHLLGLSEFTLQTDPNRDSKTSITGTLSSNKSLDPISNRNQLVVSSIHVRGKKKEIFSIALFIDYRIEDLAAALVDYENFKTEFKPYFEPPTVKQEIGYSQQEIESVQLERGDIQVIIKLAKYNNLSHTVTVECKYVRKNHLVH